eukprot:CAMPEP_0197916972 /NCGR_PEP_ID=MMETSP1439-20131203/82973_1 /TAXON_ID=66791 /ORGANISM="Gonyaulax spinifera, Strain CCMP409" /LENGTH=105 /DNA_ID=CAMNT_0043539031 /DNA_START=66 /DNA_END=380 /DNA_ORIENTATION=-
MAMPGGAASAPLCKCCFCGVAHLDEALFALWRQRLLQRDPWRAAARSHAEAAAVEGDASARSRDSGELALLWNCIAAAMKVASLSHCCLQSFTDGHVLEVLATPA